MQPVRNEPVRLHVTGASGTGTTTLAAALARRLAMSHVDTDDFYWMPTSLPFTQARPPAQRQALLEVALEDASGWVLSGSLCGWGDWLIPRFHGVVFLTLPPELRLSRLREREAERYGPRITPGGAQHETHLEFMEWAGMYDSGGLDMRSRTLHEHWLRALSCPVLRLDGDLTCGERVSRVNTWLAAIRGVTVARD